MTCDHQCEAQDTDSSWEDIESEQEDEQKLYPTLDLDSEDWAENFSESIWRFHDQTIWSETWILQVFWSVDGRSPSSGLLSALTILLAIGIEILYRPQPELHFQKKRVDSINKG